MTKPGMAGEATLDEILASIRKVLDKEGPGGKGGDEHVFAALAPAPAQSHAGAQPHPAQARYARPGGEPAAERSPLMDRIARVVGTPGHDSAAPIHPAPAPASGALEKFIESDLGDLLAEPSKLSTPTASAAGASVAPSPASSPAPISAPIPVLGPLPAPDASPAPHWPAAMAAAPSAPGAPVRGAMLPPRSEPSFAVLADPPPARSDAQPAGAADAFGTLVPSRLDTGHGSASVASRLPPLSASAATASPANASPFAAFRPGAPEPQGLPAFPAPPAGEPGKDRLAAASWSDMMRRAEDAAEAPDSSLAAQAPAAEPVVLAAMGAPRKPAAPQTMASAAAATPRVPDAKPAAAADAPPVDAPLVQAASEPVVLAAMGPKAAAAVPSPAADANPGGAPRDGLQTISRIETSAPAVAAAGSRDATPAAITASSAIAAGDADTNAAVASALGALAAGLAASSAKPAAAQMPAEPVAAQPVAAKAQQPDLVKGLSMSAAARPEVLSVAEVPAATSPASALPPLAAPSAPVPPVDAQVEIPAPVAAPLTPPAAAPAASAVDAPVASEAFLALASTPAAPRAMLPSVIGSHGMLEPESPLDDTVAELLRPMLRQWLADNMPRIVEKALRIELAESLKKEN